MKFKQKIQIILFLFIGTLLSACKDEEISSTEKRKFNTSFESVDDFSGFYISPQGYLGTSFHELNDSISKDGKFSHKAWITGANSPSTLFTNNNHRAYPTIQLHKINGGAFETPCYIRFWVWLDIKLNKNASGEENDWFSFATFTCDDSDNWDRTVLVNLSQEGYVHLMHVPYQGEQEHIFQTKSVLFPHNEWVEIKVYLDFRKNGYAKVWQNGELVSHAKIKNVSSKLAQAHFGMYSSPAIKSGVVYNDNLSIEMVEKE